MKTSPSTQARRTVSGHSATPTPHPRKQTQPVPILAPSGGTKFDTDKPRFDLIDPKAQLGLAQVLTFGAEKYEAHNWRKGLTYSRVVAAMERHLNSIKLGEYIDPETGLLHIHHVQCNAMFLARFQEDGRDDLDDLQGKAGAL